LIDRLTVLLTFSFVNSMRSAIVLIKLLCMYVCMVVSVTCGVTCLGYEPGELNQAELCSFRC